MVSIHLSTVTSVKARGTSIQCRDTYLQFRVLTLSNRRNRNWLHEDCLQKRAFRAQEFHMRAPGCGALFTLGGPVIVKFMSV